MSSGLALIKFRPEGFVISDADELMLGPGGYEQLERALIRVAEESFARGFEMVVWRDEAKRETRYTFRRPGGDPDAPPAREMKVVS